MKRSRPSTGWINQGSVYYCRCRLGGTLVLPNLLFMTTINLNNHPLGTDVAIELTKTTALIISSIFHPFEMDSLMSIVPLLSSYNLGTSFILK